MGVNYNHNEDNKNLRSKKSAAGAALEWDIIERVGRAIIICGYCHQKSG
jgi:hypothetical protein